MAETDPGALGNGNSSTNDDFSTYSNGAPGVGDARVSYRINGQRIYGLQK